MLVNRSLPRFFQELMNGSCHYDRMFHAEEGYNSKLHRDDRQHTVGLDFLSEVRICPWKISVIPSEVAAAGTGL